ncbi:hypothetical protein KHQ81_00540 [Mycoplasmatota bacterium]|nr:hypothetical protein KHQ81_00540 [Mycoplasmatota bacterium]
MNELDELKQIIDENLEHIQVSNQLKKRTLKAIQKSENGILNENNIFIFIKRNFMKTATVFSLLVIIFTISINSYLSQNNPKKITPTTNPRSLTQCPAKNEYDFDQSSESELESNDDCQINP